MTQNYNIKEINRDVFSMIIPISIEGILQMIASTVLMAMMGRVDVLAVNAVGVGTRVTQLLWAFVRGIGVGVTVTVAKDLGAKRQDKLRKNALGGIISLFCITGFFSALIYIFAGPIVRAFGGSESTIAQSIAYMRIIAPAMPFWSILLSTAGILQGLGDAKTAMVLTGFYNLINITVGYVLIFGKLGFEPLGVVGAGWAMVTSQVSMAVISLGVLLYKGVFRNISPDALPKEALFEKYSTSAALKTLYKVGIPAAFENMLWQLGALAMMKPIISYGDYAYAAHQLAMQAESISYMPTMGFGIAATSLIGRCCGAGELQKGKLYFDQIHKIMFKITLVIIGIMVIFPKQLMAILTESPDIISLGAWYLIITAATLLPQNLYGVYCGALRGAGYTKLPMYMAFAGLWLVRVPLSFVFAYLIPGTTILYIWVAMGIDLVTRYTLSRMFYKKMDVFKETTVQA